MHTILEVILFIILFALNILLLFAFGGLYTTVEQMISDSELKMNDKINELKIFIKKNEDENK